jgi:S-adenosylmethionine:tRNA ribosyltransferase-isomerase
MDPFEILDYELPPELIAQQPVARRTDARLMVIDRQAETIAHQHIRDLPDILRPGDQLVTNDSKVLPARIFGERIQTGGRVEVLYLGSDETGMWQVMVRARGQLQPKEPLMLKDLQTRDALKLWLLEKQGNGIWLAHPESEESALSILSRIGRLPLPPYIRAGMENDDDRERYQTVFAKHPGSIAAPTAGLHFTPELLKTLAKRGIPRHSVTLHVGSDTFKPVKTNDLSEHPMHSEWGEINDETAWQLQQAQAAGQRIVAVGTTSVRVLETAARASGGKLQGWTGQTRLFIYPPYQFQAVDALLTNFHLPRTTLLLLVASLMGVELTQRAYKTAIREGYRFYSYGDAMLIQ